MANVGLRIKKSFKRPPQELIDGFAGLPVANIADMMNRMFCIDASIRPVNQAPLCGPAFTISCRPGDNLLLHKALDMAQPGDILVVAAQGDLTNSIMGELMALWSIKRGLGGFIFDGAIRDVASPSPLDPAQLRVPVAMLMGERDADAAVFQDRLEFFRLLGSPTRSFHVLAGLGKYANFEHGRYRFNGTLVKVLEMP
jgi:hypothetical protein